MLGIWWTSSTALKVRELLVVSAQQGGAQRSPVMAIVNDDDDCVPKKEGGTVCLFLFPFLVVTTLRSTKCNSWESNQPTFLPLVPSTTHPIHGYHTCTP